MVLQISVCGYFQTGLSGFNWAVIVSIKWTRSNYERVDYFVFRSCWSLQYFCFRVFPTMVYKQELHCFFFLFNILVSLQMADNSGEDLQECAKLHLRFVFSLQ